MLNKLKEKICGYIDTVQSMFLKERENFRMRGSLRLVRNKAKILPDLVNELEEEDEFNQLVMETRSVFLPYHDEWDYHEWNRATKHYFRRSGYYDDLFEGKKPNFDATLKNYEEAFQRREIKITYLAPMEWVQFAESTMNFGTFQIRRFTTDELSEILWNRVNDIFYPWAAVNVNRLQDYWFIYLMVPANPLVSRISEPVDWDQMVLARIEYTSYPRAIESALQQLALYDWQPDGWKGDLISGEEDKERGWLGFKIPFVLTADDYLLGYPRSAPDLSTLERGVIGETPIGEIIEGPLIHNHLDEIETNSFNELIQHAGSLLTKIRVDQNEWQFLEIALGYFVKAFFAEGLEQLLWHIVVLEALLGEKGEGVTERLARRISSILGRNDKERKSIRKRFKELYDFRSELVHGKQFQKQTFIGHLREGRDLARRAIIWFLHYLGNIKAGIPQEQLAEILPNREDILSLLDMDEKSRLRLSRLIDSLPEGFPYIPEWVQ